MNTSLLSVTSLKAAYFFSVTFLGCWEHSQNSHQTFLFVPQALHPPRPSTAGQAEAAAVLCGVQVLSFCVPLPASLLNVMLALAGHMSAVLMVLPPPWASALPQCSLLCSYSEQWHVAVA